MNSQLEHDFHEYNYKPTDKFPEDTTEELQEYGERIELDNSIESLPLDLPKCEICDRQFVNKKDLRAHIVVHLGQPRIVLKRCSAAKTIKKKEKETYWLDPETKGSLKLTLKKHTTDALKLTLKKSSESEDFTVVNTCVEADKNSNNCNAEEEAIGTAENEQMDDKTRDDDSEQQTFENIIVNERDVYENEEDENYENEEISNPLGDNEIPSMEANEGDSGVGSDMANPSEREDQNVDDLHGVVDRNSDNNRTNSVNEENEDLEDTEALEATCRETIENLKKLGEQSSSRSLSGIGMSPRGDDDSADRPVNMTQHLEDETALNLLSKSPAYPTRSPNDCASPSTIEKEQRSPGSNSNFNWNHLSEDVTNKSNEDEDSNRDSRVNGGTDSNNDNNSLLQNFLIEHQRRNQSERNLGNNLPPVETEYVSLERLAETVRTCRVCNEKFRDITQLDEHRSKAGHYQCNLPECSSLVLSTSIELAVHKSQVHGAPLSPHINRNSPHVSEGSPHVNRNSPHSMATAASASASGSSPHGISMGSPNVNINSPMTSPQNTHSPGYPSGHLTNSPQQSAIPPVNFEQLPAPVQQLAQQVQRMPLPNLPPGASTMIPGANYYAQPSGRPPMYRMPGAPQGMHYPPHLAHLYSQYASGPSPYPPMPGPPPMHPQMAQQMSRGRYPQLGPNPRAPRMPQQGSAPRLRMKRPLQPPPPPQHQMQQPQQQRLVDPASKQRRMDLLLPDRNEDADCHVIAQQKRNDGLPVIQNVQGSAGQQSNRNDSTIHLTDSITLSVRQPATVQSPVGPVTKKPDASAVANVLAARGITVTPAANKNKTSDQQKQSTQQQQQSQQRQPTALQPVNVTALNLNSAISIIPAQRKQQEQQPQQQQQQSQPQAQFAVPQNKQNKQSSASDVERPPRPPTVDLTQDAPVPAPVVRRGRPPRALLTCQVCEKNFQNQEMLTQHMATHRTNSKLLHKCHLCPAQYPTGQALTLHKQTYHKEVDTFGPSGGIELALPVVDLKSPQVLNRLSNLGIQSYIPLSQLSAQTGGYFGLPIITIDGARNPNTCNLGALGATSILSLGPLKHLSNR